MDGNKHYIKIALNKDVIDWFSDAYRQPDNDCICVCECGERLFQIDGVDNPPMDINVKDSTIYLYRWYDAFYKKTDAEIQAEIDALPVNTTPTLEEQIAHLQAVVLALSIE